jgi:hypothetical protein
MAGFGDLDVMQRARRLTVGLVMVVLGGVVGYALPKSSAAPSGEIGSVTSVGNTTTDAGLRFSFTDSKSGKAQNLRFLYGTPWQKTASGQWNHKGQPACLLPGTTSSVKVTLGIITSSSDGTAPGGPIVAWVECYG